MTLTPSDSSSSSTPTPHGGEEGGGFPSGRRILSRQIRNINSPMLEIPGELLYVLLCINGGKLGAKLHHELLYGVSSDRDFFALLRRAYHRHRTYASWFTLRCVTKIHLARVRIPYPTTRTRFRLLTFQLSSSQSTPASTQSYKTTPRHARQCASAFRRLSEWVLNIAALPSQLISPPH
jgi:hypothetical protein